VLNDHPEILIMYLSFAGCGPNEEYSNFTLCEYTCANRNDGPPTNCEEKLKGGCVCVDDYYRDEKGVCVKYNDCDKCYVGGVVKQVGERLFITMVTPFCIERNTLIYSNWFSYKK
jgi:hypothetical protein